MADNKTFNPLEKEELLKSFGESLDDQSLRIIEAFKDIGKDLNKMLKTAWKYKGLC
jgi:hypothetical protein